MRAALMSIAVSALCTTTAHADDDVVGVVVIGDSSLQPRVTAYLEHWLETRHHSVLASPLSTDAVNTITNCLVLDDQKCARGVVDARSKSEAVLFARAEISKDKSIVINAYWFAKGHESIGERRVCEHCIGENWHSAADQMMDALTAQTFGKGHLHVESDPTGMIVLFDNVEIGLTPLDRDVPAGHHRVDLTHDGHHVGKRMVQVDANDTTDVLIKTKPEPVEAEPGGSSNGSRLVPAIVLGSGIFALGVGGVLLYYGGLGGDQQKYTYPDSTPIGIGVMAAGLGATIIGGVLFYQAGKHNSAPVASVSHDGAYVGWITRF
jgi:PEGA domain